MAKETKKEKNKVTSRNFSFAFEDKTKINQILPVRLRPVFVDWNDDRADGYVV